jgi:hypothetical protein
MSPWCKRAVSEELSGKQVQSFEDVKRVVTPCHFNRLRLHARHLDAPPMCHLQIKAANDVVTANTHPCDAYLQRRGDRWALPPKKSHH